MKEILLKLSNNENEFDIEIFGEKRKCQILKLDLWGLGEGKGRAFVRFEEPVKKIIREEVESPFGVDTDRTYMEDVEIDTYEEWVSIGY